MQENNDESKPHFHEYDGIIELDNNLPTWWLWLFFITIIFGSLYFLHYELAGGPTLKDELVVHMAELEKQKASLQASTPAETEESLATAFGALDENAGANIFATKCAACHGPQLQGLIGPNLTDHFWINGKGNRVDIVNIIRNGAPEKGMPPWSAALKRDEVYATAKFIMSKLDSKPAGAKAPEGEEVK